MPFCIYDSPVTMARECWEDKILIWHMSATLIEDKHFRKFNPKCGPWKTGYLIGDKEAIETNKAH